MNDHGTQGGWPPKPTDFDDDLEPQVKDEEREALAALAMRLKEDRPVPSPGMRNAIQSKLIAEGSSTASSRIGRLILGYATSGALLLLVATAGLVGVGPFAA
jgi:hypothetical protein